MIEWEDITQYQTRPKIENEPATHFRAVIGVFWLYVFRDREVWRFICEPIAGGNQFYALDATTAFAAKLEAVELLRGALREALYAMQPDCGKCRNKKQSSITGAVFCDAGGVCFPDYGEVASDE